LRRRLAIVVLLALSCTAQAQGLACRGGESAMVTAELLFGRNIGGRLGVTERRWSDFLAREVTPRFPDGLTVIDGAGQWRGKRGLVRERSKLVLIVMPDDDAAREKIAAIVAGYKRRFRQDSVGVLTRPVCAAF
jgi:hypothetical protein